MQYDVGRYKLSPWQIFFKNVINLRIFRVNFFRGVGFHQNFKRNINRNLAKDGPSQTQKEFSFSKFAVLMPLILLKI